MRKRSFFLFVLALGSIRNTVRSPSMVFIFSQFEVFSATKRIYVFDLFHILNWKCKLYWIQPVSDLLI